jgi:hypothetical protein
MKNFLSIFNNRQSTDSVIDNESDHFHSIEDEYDRSGSIEPDLNQSAPSLFLLYFRNTAIIKIFFHFLFVILTCVTISISYVAIFHWDDLFEMYNESRHTRMFGQNLKTNIVLSDKMQNILENLLIKSPGSTRSYIFRYHNGITAVNDIPFFFQSNIQEAVSPGISQLITIHQRIPVIISNIINIEFIKNKF